MWHVMGIEGHTYVYAVMWSQYINYSNSAVGFLDNVTDIFVVVKYTNVYQCSWSQF